MYRWKKKRKLEPVRQLKTTTTMFIMSTHTVKSANIF